MARGTVGEETAENDTVADIMVSKVVRIDPAHKFADGLRLMPM